METSFHVSGHRFPASIFNLYGVITDPSISFPVQESLTEFRVEPGPKLAMVDQVKAKA